MQKKEQISKASSRIEMSRVTGEHNHGTHQFMDSRPEYSRQKALQRMVDNSVRLAQLTSFQQIANRSFQGREGIIQGKVVQFWPPKSDDHLKEQASVRSISESEIDTAVSSGKQYYDPDYGSTVYWDSKSGVAVCQKANGWFKTCYRRSSPKERWK